MMDYIYTVKHLSYSNVPAERSNDQQQLPLASWALFLEILASWLRERQCPWDGYALEIDDPNKSRALII
jgi:hypothetical protein